MCAPSRSSKAPSVPSLSLPTGSTSASRTVFRPSGSTTRPVATFWLISEVIQVKSLVPRGHPTDFASPQPRAMVRSVSGMGSPTADLQDSAATQTMCSPCAGARTAQDSSLHRAMEQSESGADLSTHCRRSARPYCRTVRCPIEPESDFRGVGTRRAPREQGIAAPEVEVLFTTVARQGVFRLRNVAQSSCRRLHFITSQSLQGDCWHNLASHRGCFSVVERQIPKTHPDYLRSTKSSLLAR